MAENKKIISIVEKLWKEPVEKNWKIFASLLKKSGIKYYRVNFQNEGKLNKVQDLAKSFVELYDAKYKLVTKVPIFMKDGKKLTGATIYLMGLQVVNGMKK